jgi:hypothetical protein
MLRSEDLNMKNNPEPKSSWLFLQVVLGLNDRRETKTQ